MRCVYNVSPAVVRHRTESFSDAFESHEKRYASNLDKVDKWKAALTEVANLSGYDLQNDADGYEIRFIQMIVKKVLLQSTVVMWKYLQRVNHKEGKEMHRVHHPIWTGTKGFVI
ncbi:hypothetical protein POM88_016013 [Heracleum sosnowskyi]|uniref:TIR domain-containing protein n=1 Tax=Heracleum sosnowskyi TaxID=360622 RepID=A0AAD8IPS2_9APIA|nr:hypothetical protein POM88_016013 [Heracleum sosnowskyi]